MNILSYISQSIQQESPSTQTQQTGRGVHTRRWSPCGVLLPTHAVTPLTTSVDYLLHFWHFGIFTHHLPMNLLFPVACLWFLSHLVKHIFMLLAPGPYRVQRVKLPTDKRHGLGPDGPLTIQPPATALRKAWKTAHTTSIGNSTTVMNQQIRSVSGVTLPFK